MRVIDPSRAAHERRDGVAVYVVDLDRAGRARARSPARVLSREAFETGALAQLAPGASSVLPAAGQPGAGGRRPSRPGAAAPPRRRPAGGPAVVTLYGTSWCGACKSARSYLRDRRIPFADKDIERDAAAARELREKARAAGRAAPTACPSWTCAAGC